MDEKSSQEIYFSDETDDECYCAIILYIKFEQIWKWIGQFISNWIERKERNEFIRDLGAMFSCLNL